MEYYADDAMERDWFDSLDDDEEIGGLTSITELEFKFIKRETEKAWLLVMSGDHEKWYPKKFCKIKGNLIQVPEWLVQKITKDANKYTTY